MIAQDSANGFDAASFRDSAKALKEMAEILDIPIERTVAIGDSMNDFDMITAAGIGVAMGNAVDKIKEISDFVTDDVDSSGVSSALCKIFNISI